MVGRIEEEVNHLVPGIYGFTTDETRWMSNYWFSEGCTIDGIPVPTNEHKYQAAKAKTAADRNKILFRDFDKNNPYEIKLPFNFTSPGTAKRIGGQISICEDWDVVKDEVMLAGLREKFSNPEMAKKLIDTDDLYLEETNWWNDTYWGVCNGKGLNKLGLMLMKVRNELNGRRD